MRRVWFAFELGSVVVVSAAVAAGCAFLLDTDKLQEGTGDAGIAGQGGQAGSGGQGGSGATDGGTPCESDLDCIDGIACSRNTCDEATNVCVVSPHQGPALFVDGDSFEIDLAEEVGVPIVTTDGTDFWVGAWTVKGPNSDAHISKHYDAVARNFDKQSLIAASASLDRFEQVFSSPALLTWVAGPPRLDLVVAAKTEATTVPRMFHVVLDSNSLEMTDIASIETSVSYLTYPAGRNAPRVFRQSPTRNVAMWVNHVDDTLKTYEWNPSVAGTPPVDLHDFDTTKIKNAVPVVGAVDGVYGAVLETFDGLSANTHLWTGGGGALSTFLSSAAGQRFGIASAPVRPLSDGNAPMNLVAWSQELGGASITSFGGAQCNTAACGGTTFADTDADLPFTARPSVAAVDAVGVDAGPLRDLVITAVAHFAPPPPDPAVGGVILSGSRTNLATETLDSEILIDWPYVSNPQEVLPALDQSPFQHTAIAVNNLGKVIVVWTQRSPDDPRTSLRARRYHIETCN